MVNTRAYPIKLLMWLSVAQLGDSIWGAAGDDRLGRHETHCLPAE